MDNLAFRRGLKIWGGLGLFLTLFLPAIVIAVSRSVDAALVPASLFVLFGRFVLPVLVAVLWTVLCWRQVRRANLSRLWLFMLFPCAAMAASQLTSVGFRLTNGLSTDIFRSWPSVWPLIVTFGFGAVLYRGARAAPKAVRISRAIIGIVFCAVAWVFLLAIPSNFPHIGGALSAYISAVDWLMTPIISAVKSVIGIHPYTPIALIWLWFFGLGRKF